MQPAQTGVFSIALAFFLQIVKNLPQRKTPESWARRSRRDMALLLCNLANWMTGSIIVIVTEMGSMFVEVGHCIQSLYAKCCQR